MISSENFAVPLYTPLYKTSYSRVINDVFQEFCSLSRQSFYNFSFLRRNIPSKILNGLCSSLCLHIIIFLAFVDKKHPPWLCITTSALLHFFILNCFSWTLVEAVILYLKVVKVMSDYLARFVTKAVLFTLVRQAHILWDLLNT